MKILRCIHSMNPAGGGPAEGIRRISQRLLDLGHHVEIASLDSPDASWLGGGVAPMHALGPGLGKYGYSSRWIPWLRENSTK